MTGANWDVGSKLALDTELQNHIADGTVHSNGIGGSYNYEVAWNHDTALATAYNLKTGATITTNADFGLLVNQVGQDSQLLGPTAADGMGTVGCSIKLATVGSTNDAIPITATNFIGKPKKAGIDGVCTAGSTTFTSASVDFTGLVGYIISVQSGDSGPNQHIDIITAVSGGGHTATLGRNCELSFTNVAFSVAPSLTGVRLWGDGGGTRGVGNDHPDTGSVVLQATGSGWNEVAVLDFRAAAQWRTGTIHTDAGTGDDDGGITAVGTHNFECFGIAIDPNDKADYAICGFGVGLGGACRVMFSTFGYGTHGGAALGNIYDSGGNSDTIFQNCLLQGPPNPVTTDYTGADGVALSGIGTLNVTSTTGLPSQGYGEIVTSKGTQLIFWTGKTGTTLTGVKGGIGNLSNTAPGNRSRLNFYSYGFQINLGDQWYIAGTNVTSNNHALLINAQSGSRCTISGGHWGGGAGNNGKGLANTNTTGGSVIVIAVAKHVYIGELYIDNIEGDRGGIWICPIEGGSGVGDVVVSPHTYFHLNDANAVPVCLDGAHAGSASIQFHISGQSTGNTAISPGFLRFANSWPNGHDVVLSHIKALRTAAVWCNDAGTSATPDAIDAPTITVAATNVAGSTLAVPWLMQGYPTASYLAATAYGDGALIYDTNQHRYKHGDATAYRLIRSSLIKDLGSNAGATQAVSAAQGDYFKVASTGATPAAFKFNNPTSAAEGMEITLEVKNSQGGAMGALTFDTKYVLTNGAVTAPANTLRRKWTFRYDSAVDQWIEQYRSSADY